MLEYFVDKIYLTDDGLVVTSWYSEDRTEVTWDMLYGEDGNPFVKGEAVKFDCFPFGSTRENIRISVEHTEIRMFCVFDISGQTVLLCRKKRSGYS